MAGTVVISTETPVVGVAPDLSREAFIAVLKGTQAEGEAFEAYTRIVREGVSPAFALAVFKHESNFGREGICARYDTKNPGNVRSSSLGTGVEIATERGTFVKFARWSDGFADLAHRLVSDRYPYARQGATTIGEILPIYAPPEDGNNPQAYIRSVVASMQAWIAWDREEEAMDRPLRVALSAGHHNTDGGNGTEIGITGELTEAYARAFRAAGADVRVITPDGGDADAEAGDGHYPGGLQAVARQVVGWAQQGWVADLFLETHTEGVGDPRVRGVFAIYPDWGSDVDTDVRDRLGPALARAIAGATGLPVRGNGVMSEKATGVGISGYRLGIFYATEAIAGTTTRMIVEHGAHSSPDDLAIIRSPRFNDAVAKAAVQVVYAFYGASLTGAVPETPSLPDVELMPTGKHYGHGFLALFRQLEAAGDHLGLRTLGYPLTEEFAVDGLPGPVFQVTERVLLKYDPSVADPWRIHVAPHDAAWIRDYAREKGLMAAGEKGAE